MKILGIETSSYCGSVAVTEDNNVLCEFLVNTGPRHSEKIMLMIDRILHEVEIERNEIDVISVSTGPGSFTSLRVGLSIAKAIAYSLGLKISGVSSLDTLAAGISSPGCYVCPVIDARRGEVYSKLVAHERPGEPIIDEHIISVEELCSNISNRTVFVGEGAVLYSDAIKKAVGRNAYFAPAPLNLPRASFMCGISFDKVRSGRVDNVFSLTPNYIRESDAEGNYRKKS